MKTRGTLTLAIVVCFIDITSHPKVANLDGEVSGHHTVTSCQITVYELLASQVGHPISNLHCHLLDLL